MPAFRLYSQLQTFYGNEGQILANGYLLFYEAGTTTPRDVYGDKDLATNNGPRVDLDASGRPEVAIWGNTDDAYFVELFNSADVKQGEEDDVEVPGGAGQTIPVPDSGEFLTGDGANFAVATIREVPDPTGNADDYLQADGTNWFWAAGPETPTVPTLPITVTANSVVFGTSGSDFCKVEWDTDQAPAASSAKETTVAVAFASAYLAAPQVVVTPKNSSGSSVYAKVANTTVSTTGFTVTLSTKTGGTSADNTTSSNITSAIDFDWVAIGTVADPT